MESDPIRDTNINRSGQYIQQPEGYRAFIPKLLPPEPPVRIDQAMQVLLSRADRALGRLDGSIQSDIAASRPLCLHVRSKGGGFIKPNRRNTKLFAGRFGRGSKDIGSRSTERCTGGGELRVGDESWIGPAGYAPENSLVSRLMEIGILQEFTGHSRNRRFIHQSYIQLFRDSELEED